MLGAKKMLQEMGDIRTYCLKRALYLNSSDI